MAGVFFAAGGPSEKQEIFALSRQILPNGEKFAYSPNL
jgi:hypothetical protein